MGGVGFTGLGFASCPISGPAFSLLAARPRSKVPWLSLCCEQKQALTDRLGFSLGFRTPFYGFGTVRALIIRIGFRYCIL